MSADRRSIYVEGLNGEVIEFPADMPEEQIQAVLQKHYGAMPLSKLQMYNLTAPDGRVFPFTVPKGATQDQIAAAAQNVKKRVLAASSAGPTPPQAGDSAAPHGTWATAPTDPIVDELMKKILVLGFLDVVEPVRWEKVCDPRDLVSNHVSGGIQGELVDAQRRLDTWESIPFTLIGAVVGALCAVPWLWYFVLDRIREFSHAVRG